LLSKAVPAPSRPPVLARRALEKRQPFLINGCLRLKLSHSRKMLNGFGKFGDGPFCVPMLDAFSNTMIQMTLQNHLSGFMQSPFGRIHLYQYILAGDILVNRLVNRFELPYDFVRPSVQIIRVHTLAHVATLLISG
jgi:hypothetical protein